MTGAKFEGTVRNPEESRAVDAQGQGLSWNQDPGVLERGIEGALVRPKGPWTQGDGGTAGASGEGQMGGERPGKT